MKRFGSEHGPALDLMLCVSSEEGGVFVSQGQDAQEKQLRA